MRKYLIPAVAVAALGLATPALAYDTNDVISMQEAWVSRPISVLSPYPIPSLPATNGRSRDGICQVATWRWTSTPPLATC